MTASRNDFGFISDYKAGAAASGDNSLACVFPSVQFDRFIRRIEWSFHPVDDADYPNPAIVGFASIVCFCSLYIVKGIKQPETYQYSARTGKFNNSNTPEIIYNQTAAIASNMINPQATDIGFRLVAGYDYLVAVSLIELYDASAASTVTKPGARTLNVLGETLTEEQMYAQKQSHWR